jgi:hypothetical protein
LIEQLRPNLANFHATVWFTSRTVTSDRSLSKPWWYFAGDLARSVQLSNSPSVSTDT